MFGWFKKSKVTKEQPKDWEAYKGYRLCATPIQEGGQFRVSGIIELDGDEIKSHTFVRADLIPSHSEAIEFSLMKARLMVDQLGDRIFSD